MNQDIIITWSTQFQCLEIQSFRWWIHLDDDGHLDASEIREFVGKVLIDNEPKSL